MRVEFCNAVPPNWLWDLLENNTENVFRETHRSTKSIVVIHHVDETNLVKELGEIANSSDIRLRMELEKWNQYVYVIIINDYNLVYNYEFMLG